MEKRMLKKKSYMDKSNLMNEGILDKILDLIRKGKTNKLRKSFSDTPKINKQIEKVKKSHSDLQSILKKYDVDLEDLDL